MKNYYYDITIVNREDRDKTRSVPVLLDVEYDTDDGANRELIVEMALFKNLITKEELQHICEVESMTYDEFVDLLQHNKERDYVTKIKAVKKAHFDAVKASEASMISNVNYFLQQYVEEAAFYGIGDTLKAKNMNSYLKVESVSGRLHYIDNRIAIIYHGTYYRKYKGEMVLMKGTKVGKGQLSEERCTLYDAVIDKV